MTPLLRRPLVGLPLLIALGGCSNAEKAGTNAGVIDGLMVISTDSAYQGSVVNLVDLATKRVPGSPCLISAMSGDNLSFSISGDLALPSQPFPGSQALIIDRTYGTLTWLDPAHCEVTSQYQVAWREASVDPKNAAQKLAYKANPHDAAISAKAQLYVSRYFTNPAPTADPSDLDEGGDLYIMDYQNMRQARRIDLAPYAIPTAEGLPTDPMPDRMIILDNQLYVSLNNLTRDFKAAGPGRIVVVDLATDTVAGTIDLPSLKNCGTLRVAPGTTKAIAVACNGYYRDMDQMAASGIAWIDLSTTVPTVTVVPAALFGAPVSGSDLAIADPAHAFTLVAGKFDGSRPDILWAFDFAGSAPRQVYAGSGAYTLAGVQYHAPSTTLFLGDANTTLPGILPFDLTNIDAPVLGPLIDNDPDYHLYPRALAFF